MKAFLFFLFCCLLGYYVIAPLLIIFFGVDVAQLFLMAFGLWGVYKIITGLSKA